MARGPEYLHIMSQFEADLKGKSDSAAFALQLNLDMQASRCVKEEGSMKQ